MLTGETKKAYQREYMREYQRRKRSKQTGLNNNGSKQQGLNNVTTSNIPISQIDTEGKEYRINHYGCGCVKTDKVFCDKHNRG